MSIENNLESNIQEILEFLSRLESGEFSISLSYPSEPNVLSPVIDKLNKLSQALAAQTQKKAEKVLGDSKKNLRENADRVTERKNLDGALKESENEFRLLAESMPQIVWTTRADGWNIFFNHQWVEYTGLTLEESYGNGWNKPFHPEDQKRAWLAWQNATKHGATYSLRCRLRRADGVYKWWLVRGVPVKDARGIITKWFGTCTDIDELMQAEIAIGESEKRYRDLFSSMDEGFCIIEVIFSPGGSPVDCRFKEVNSAFQKHFGLLNETSRKLIQDLVPNYNTQGLEAFGRVALTGESIRFTSEAKSLNRHFDIYAYRIGNPEDHQVAVLLSDITESLQREKAQAALEAAESANRSKDQFLATLSHELRSPLTAILSWSQLIERGNLPPEKVKTGIRTIKESALSQSQLISDLLDISRIVTGKMIVDRQPTNVLDVIMSAVETVRPIAEQKAIVIEESIEATDLYVTADPGRLKQALWNILSNSVKFTPEGGKIVVTLDHVDDDQQRSARIKIQDTGKGIEAAFLPQLFNRFSQADSSSIRLRGGMGLGLSLVKSLVELQGGTVTAFSPGEGSGATFTVTFPLLGAERERSRPSMRAVSEKPPAEGLELSGLKVLLVEDEENTRVAVDQVLASLGANVKSVSSAKAAIEVFGEFHPDVVVSDLAMPGEDGFSLIRKIRKLGREKGGGTPAVALTAYADSENRKEALAAGFQAHLSKPVETTELVRTILKTKSAS